MEVKDISASKDEKEDEEEEVDTVVEELRGLSHLRIKPRVVISDAKHKKTTGSPAEVATVAPAAASSGIIERGRLCSVCATKFGRYTCPRCNAASCSLPCYKAHSTKCTEAFYKDSVEEELRSQRADEESQKRMLQLLKHMKDQEDEEEEDEHEEEAYYRLAQLSTEENLSLEHLTPEQREDFKRSLVDGRISDMITPWQPWWLQPASGLIVPVETKREDENENESESEDEVEVEERKPPPVLPDIPPLSTLLSKEPSPLLAFNLLDILFSYAYVMRYFNGEPDSEASDASSFLVEISAVLQSNAVHQSPDAAFDACLANILKPSVSGSSDFGLAVVDDVRQIVAQKHFTLMALSDLHALLGRAAADQIAAATKEVKRLRAKLAALQKKVYFFVAWANAQDEPLFRATAALVEAYLREQRAKRPDTTTAPSSSTGSLRLPTTLS